MMEFGFRTLMVAKPGGNEMLTPGSTTPRTPMASTGLGMIGKLPNNMPPSRAVRSLRRL